MHLEYPEERTMRKWPVLPCIACRLRIPSIDDVTHVVLVHLLCSAVGEEVVRL
jgi:hypothetical protein